MKNFKEHGISFFKRGKNAEKASSGQELETNTPAMIAAAEISFRTAGHSDDVHRHRAHFYTLLFKDYNLKPDRAADIAAEEIFGWNAVTYQEKEARFTRVAELISAFTHQMFGPEKIERVATLLRILNENALHPDDVLEGLAELHALVFNIPAEHQADLIKAAQHYVNAHRHFQARKLLKESPDMEKLVGSNKKLEEKSFQEFLKFYSQLEAILQKTRSSSAS
jgi:hypothetical protein